MSTRSEILARIRSSLRAPAPRPQSPPPGRVFNSIPPPEFTARFEKELVALKGDFKSAKTWDEAQAWIEEVVRTYTFQNITVAPDNDAMKASVRVPFKVPNSAQDYGSSLKQTDLAITPCSFLIAQTGSVLLTCDSGYGRAFSVLPHAHLVVVHRSQLIGSLGEAYAELRARHGSQWPSMITIITGPSRTADIEKILVLGAHGPKKLFVLLLDF